MIEMKLFVHTFATKGFALNHGKNCKFNLSERMQTKKTTTTKKKKKKKKKKKNDFLKDFESSVGARIT